VGKNKKFFNFKLDSTRDAPNTWEFCTINHLLAWVELRVRKFRMVSGQSWSIMKTKWMNMVGSKNLKIIYITGWWLTYPSEKSWASSVGMMTFPIDGKS